jgi:hypothetical protein
MSLARARALAILAVLVVFALVLVVIAVFRDKQARSNYSAFDCPAGAVKISTRLPDPAKIKINVLNGTGTADSKGRSVGAVPGLAGQVADEFRNRGFVVVTVADRPQKYGGVAKLSYGPKEVGAAAVVEAYFLGNNDPGGFDIKRNDDVVDVVVGSGYENLGTKTEVNQKIAQLGNPSPPPGTCDTGH